MQPLLFIRHTPQKQNKKGGFFVLFLAAQSLQSPFLTTLQIITLLIYQHFFNFFSD